MRKLKLYAAKANEIHAQEREMLWTLLDRDRQATVLSLRNKKEKERSICAGLLLRHAFLEAGYGIKDWQQVQIEKGVYGKPYMKGYDDFQYSLSHSGEWTVCAVDIMPIGADIQEMKSWKLQLAKRFYHADEYDRLLAIKENDSDRRTREFYSIWTAKESVVKWNGRGIGAGISGYVTAQDYSQVYDVKERQMVHIRLYNELEGYMTCVCSRMGDFPDKLKIVNLW